MIARDVMTPNPGIPVTNPTDLEHLLSTAREHRASDLILSAGSPPTLRIDGLIRMMEGRALDGASTQALVYGILTAKQARHLELYRELDFSLTLQGHRLRGNVYWQSGSVAAAFRLLPDTIPRPEDLGIPEIAVDFVQRPQGLLLITGSSSQGKTTTQASLVNHVNRHAAKHIITVEDPVEFVHANELSIVDQREVGSDTLSFAEALRHALRESPDIIVVGEMRDPETMRAALISAETGHLVLSTLHTNDACQALDRIVESFPESEQSQIRAQLSLSLLAVLAQRLVQGRNGRLFLASEILCNTHAVANAIREGHIHQLYSIMEAGRKHGMWTMNQALEDLHARGVISEAEINRYMSVHESYRAKEQAPTGRGRAA
jgi:twitching motility protein PilT